MSSPILSLVATSAIAFAGPEDANPLEAEAGILAECVEEYARFAHSVYRVTRISAESLRDATRDLAQNPSEEALNEAKNLWIMGRNQYGWTEALRFYSGPIDHPEHGPETLINAWPVDEAYIDYVEGDWEAGIINDRQGVPVIEETILTVLNERGGEANVSVGWHAIEFLLWGQDLSPDGPGDRHWTDYAPDAPNADRRAAYLQTVAELLARHLLELETAWAPDDPTNYRASFEQEPDEALRKILTGLAVLSGFEMSAERLGVAYETQDQEQEHSCFSDMTDLDLHRNQDGIMAIWFGGTAGGRGKGVRALAHKIDPATAELLDKQMNASKRAISQIPHPFDQAILGEDDAPGRKAILEAIEALEAQSESLIYLGSVMGMKIPRVPAGT